MLFSAWLLNWEIVSYAFFAVGLFYTTGCLARMKKSHQYCFPAIFWLAELALSIYGAYLLKTGSSCENGKQ